MSDKPSTAILSKLGYCEYLNKNVPVFYTYFNETLFKVECPSSSCARQRFCPLHTKAPKLLRDFQN